MKLFYLLIIAFTLTCCSTNPMSDNELDSLINKSIEKSISQYKYLAESLNDTLLPRTVENGTIKQVNIYDWTSGFFPASLWYLYDYSNDENIRKIAQKYTHLLEPLKDYTYTHDLGFMVFCPYNNAFNATLDSSYLEVIVKASESLITRYNPRVELIRSWDDPYWQYPVIIDNMMNLEMLTQATKLSGDSTFYTIAKAHSDKTLANHFRKDHSSYHLVSYDTITGHSIKKQTAQGYADESAWARGQSWALYGYTSMFREIGDSSYLRKAIGIADFLLNHENMPSDGVPYWDYNAPKIPDEPKDVAAAAIMASALIELDNYVTDKQYLKFAKKIVISLSDKPYFADEKSNHGFILKHSTGHFPANSEIDAPLNYADYYYIESLIRLMAKLE